MTSTIVEVITRASYMPSRTCAHCGGPIPDTLRRGTRFCKAACRVNRNIKARMAATFSDDVPLNRIEAGLLIDAAEPWATCLGSNRAKQVQMAWRRLASLGLVRVGRLHGSYRQTVIERTALGTSLLARRHNELHAIAERGNGKLLSDTTRRVSVVHWRDGGVTVCTPETVEPL